MKLLLEQWRKYINERIDSLPPTGREEFDLGTSFKTISKLDIIEDPSTDMHIKNSLLDMFLKLKETDNTDPTNGITVDNILKSIYTFSGNSEDFIYATKKDAIEDYYASRRYGQKSLKDHHDAIKKAVYAATRSTKPAYWGDEG
tara:strand:- start:1037 stop:1468 length:432 start_codon:yes stop_codon:yes gene_type:complete